MVCERRIRTALLVLGLVPLAVLLPLAGYGEGAKEGSRTHGHAAAAAQATGGSAKFRDACAEGNTKYAARDFAGAIESYREAIELDPTNPLGHYLAGEAQLASGNLAGAEVSWTRASLVTTDRDASVTARVLFCLADLKEREKKWPEAKTAWESYVEFAAKSPEAGAFPSSGQSREQVIDTMLKLDNSYEIVRKRIAEAEDGGVFSDPSKPAPSAG